jgi:hypothetical protein
VATQAASQKKGANAEENWSSLQPKLGPSSRTDIKEVSAAVATKAASSSIPSIPVILAAPMAAVHVIPAAPHAVMRASVTRKSSSPSFSSSSQSINPTAERKRLEAEAEQQRAEAQAVQKRAEVEAEEARMEKAEKKKQLAVSTAGAVPSTMCI